MQAQFYINNYALIIVSDLPSSGLKDLVPLLAGYKGKYRGLAKNESRENGLSTLSQTRTSGYVQVNTLSKEIGDLFMLRTILTLSFLLVTLSYSGSSHQAVAASCEAALKAAVKSCSRSKSSSDSKVKRCVIEAMTRQQFEESTHYSFSGRNKYSCAKK